MFKELISRLIWELDYAMEKRHHRNRAMKMIRMGKNPTAIMAKPYAYSGWSMYNNQLLTCNERDRAYIEATFPNGV